MAEYEERYEGNGDHANVNHGEMADFESQNESHDYERGASKCIERETEKGRSHTRDGDQERDGSRARDRDIGSEREKDRERDRDRDMGSEREKDRDREPNRDRDVGVEREKDRDRENRDMGKEKERDRERDKHKEIDRERDKHRDTDRGRDRERDKERERGREHDRERVRERDRERDKDLDRHRSRDRDRNDRDRDRNDRDREVTERRENHHSRDDDDNDSERHRSREHDRHRSYDRESHHRHRSHSRSRGRSSRRSRSRDRSSRRSRSRSRSRSKSKRVSGFDLAPPAAALMPGVTLPGQINGAMPTPLMPGMYPNMINPLMPGQVPAFSLMPMQTQPATLHARRVYVGGIPPSANEQTVATFFSQVMQAIGGNAAGPGNAVVNVYINHDKKFAFVEMRSVEEASNAMALDGIHFEGALVKVRRPSDYNPSHAAALGPSQPNPNLNLAAVGLTPGSAGGLEGPDRIFVGGLPYYFTESQVRELLESFGALRGFDLVKDRETGNSKGYAFCVYQDVSVTDIACAALNGIKMGDKTLTVRRANQGVVQPRPEQEIVLL